MVAKINISGALLPVMEQFGVELVNLFAGILTAESTCCHHDLHTLCEGDREIRGGMTRENVNRRGGNDIREVLAGIEAAANLSGTNLRAVCNSRQHHEGASVNIKNRLLCKHGLKVDSFSTDDCDLELSKIILGVRGFIKGMYLVCAHNFVDLGVRVLFLKLAQSLETTGIDAAKLKGGKGKFILALAGALDNLASLVLGKIERVADLDGLALEIPAISGNVEAAVGLKMLHSFLKHRNVGVGERIE